METVNFDIHVVENFALLEFLMVGNDPLYM